MVLSLAIQCTNSIQFMPNAPTSISPQGKSRPLCSLQPALQLRQNTDFKDVSKNVFSRDRRSNTTLKPSRIPYTRQIDLRGSSAITQKLLFAKAP